MYIYMYAYQQQQKNGKYDIRGMHAFFITTLFFVLCKSVPAAVLKPNKNELPRVG